MAEPKKKYGIVVIWAIIGIISLSVLSTFQKTLIGSPPEAYLRLKAYLIPIIYGAVAGILIGFYIHKNRSLQKSLEEKNRALKKKNTQITFMNEELQETLAQIEEAKENAEAGNRLKARFLENISHEIRTPMNGIIGFSTLLQTEPDSEKSGEYIGHIKSSCKRLTDVIDGIIDISQIQSKQVVLQETELDIEKLVSDVYDKLKPFAEQKDLDFELADFDYSGDLFIKTDPLLLQSIISNIIDNAIKYTQKGKIEVSLKDKPDFIEIAVKDTGIGIKNENLQKIFENFSHADYESAVTYGGLGVGLTIAKGYAEILNGYIDVDSEFEKGSVFKIYIPNKKVRKPAELPAVDNGKTTRILLAEDDETSYFLIEELLSEVDCKVFWAKNGYEAIDLYHKHINFDIVITDLKMPDADGFFVIREIKKLNENIPIIVQTAFSSGDEIDKALRAGASDFVLKPFTQNTFVEKLKPYCNKKSSKNE